MTAVISPESKRKSSGSGRQLLSWGFAAAIVIALVWRLGTAWREVDHVSLDPLLLASASVALAVYTVMMMLTWHQLLVSVDSSVTPQESSRLYLIANLAGFLPGKVGSILAVAHYSGSSHRRQVIAGGALVVFQILNIAAAIVPVSLGMSAVTFSGIGIWKWALTAVLTLMFVSLMPRLAPSLVGGVARVFGREAPQFDLRLETAGRVWFGISVAWLTIGVSVFLFVRAMGVSISWSTLPFVEMAFAVSYVAGVLSFIAPGGLGVREGALAVLLTRIVPEPTAILISLALRLWMSVVMILTPLIILLFLRRPFSRR